MFRYTRITPLTATLRNTPSASRIATLTLSAAALAAAAVLWQPTRVVAAASPQSPAPNTIDFYNQRVLPILQTNCYRCHGGFNHRGGLNIVTRAGLLKGGHDGAVIVPGDASKSLLVKLIRHEGPADDPMPMPPKSKISDADIATITQWINAGAIMPDTPPE